MKIIKLPFVQQLEEQLQKPRPLIQVVLGPRQVGKTTGVQKLLTKYGAPHVYSSADGPISKDPSWITQAWLQAENQGPNTLLIIDEVQKVEQWSEAIKVLWDQEQMKGSKIKVILLGSSSLSLQKGLTESLAGRFYLHKVWHWNPQESFDAYGLSFEEYLSFGGYPASYTFIHQLQQWNHYVRESIINSVIGKDILSLVRVKSPALFRQCFDLACSYPAQEISYNKLLGQLQSKGNTDLVKNYLEHFEAAFLIKQLHKFSTSKLSRKTSSPKIVPLCPALYTSTLDGHLNEEQQGRAFELTIAMALLRKPGQLYYWRDKNLEVDFVYEYQKKIVAIEVKSSRIRKTSGLHAFGQNFKNSELKLITMDNYQKILDSI